jgi:TolB-like protein/AraC-like DNA-binding protein
MPDSNSIKGDFLSKITGIIEENISDERFGVSELANEIGMSRSNLLRKIKKATKLSVSQFIREVRLKNGMEMLREKALTVSEVSYEVGFGSTSYFIKCFHDYYGYPPGEVGKRELDESGAIRASQSGNEPKTGQVKRTKFGGEFKSWKDILFTILIGILLVVVVILVYPKIFKSNDQVKLNPELEKSIAVLPFKNDSNDSTNVYIINGLMESILTNLQNIEDLRVISRTSVEKYRTHSKTIPEISKDLNVNYFVEGSGQKIGDKILLNIQLIDASTDKHLWAEQYKREAKDIFELQQEVAKNIAGKIEVIITPEEAARIDKIPTDNLVAYDYFLKGQDLFYKGNREGLEEAIPNFMKAIEHDDEFARAYADIAISYYFLDIQQAEKQHSVLINDYADKALSFDPKSAESLIAKALYYMNIAEQEMAVPYLEKALQYNPNSALVIGILSDFYTTYIPNKEKYLEYALKGIQLDIAAHDSVTASYIYLHVGNALIQSGFRNEAEKHINKSLKYNPENLYSEYVKAYILYAKNRDLHQLKELLINTYHKDTTRLDVIQEVGKSYYFMRDYERAYYYYKKFIDRKKAQNLDINEGEDAKIGVVLDKLGLAAESDRYFTDYLEYAENDRSIYKEISLAAYYSYKGDTKKAIEHLRLFSQQDNYHFWIIIFIKIDPLMDNLKELPEFQHLLNDIEKKFWDSHQQIRATLEEKELL